MNLRELKVYLEDKNNFEKLYKIFMYYTIGAILFLILYGVGVIPTPSHPLARAPFVLVPLSLIISVKYLLKYKTELNKKNEK